MHTNVFDFNVSRKLLFLPFSFAVVAQLPSIGPAVVPYHVVNLNEMLTSDRRECDQSERIMLKKHSE